jgi:hypothetical protein
MCFAEPNQRESGRRAMGWGRRGWGLPSLLLGLVCALGLTLGAHAQSPEERESAIKAGFLYNFFSYVQWPEKVQPTGQAAFVVGVVGDASCAPLVALLQGKMVKGRRLEVRLIDETADLAGLHLIFVSETKEVQVRALLARSKLSPVLTVGEGTGFLREGGMINLVQSRNRIQLEINPGAAEQAGLTLSSQLLKLARIVKS